jgi:hypothetical protein
VGGHPKGGEDLGSIMLGESFLVNKREPQN